MRILVTGASGFVGQHVVSAMVVADDEIVAVSRKCTNDRIGNVRYIKADLLDASQSLAPLFDGPIDTVVHLAWTVDHGAFWTTPDNLDWIAASLRLARTAAEHGVRRFVGVGTCYEYLWPDDDGCDEYETPVVPSTLYGISKDATRRVLSSYFDSVGVEFAWCRLFFLYGPGEGPNRLVPSLARALVRGEPAPCSSGHAIRDFIDVRDAGEAIARVARTKAAGPINIASGDAISVLELARCLAAASGQPELLRPGALADRPGEPPRIVAKVKRLRQEIGFVPHWTLKQGLRNAMDYWRADDERNS